MPAEIKPKSVILYRLKKHDPESPLPEEYDLVAVRVPGADAVVSEVIIRAEVFDGDVGEALAAAKPREWEVLINTVPLN